MPPWRSDPLESKRAPPGGALSLRRLREGSVPAYAVEDLLRLWLVAAVDRHVHRVDLEVRAQLLHRGSRVDPLHHRILVAAFREVVLCLRADRKSAVLGKSV